MPIKLITLVRSDDLPAWREALVARIDAGIPGLVRMVFNTVLPVDVRPADGPAPEHWDAVLESWFETRADLDAWAASAPGGGLLVDLIVDQKFIHDSGIRPLPAKVLVTFRRRPDITRAQAQAHWRGRHVEVGLVENDATDFLRLYFQNHVIDGNRVDRPEHDYDGLPEFWLDQDALAMVGPDSPVMRAIAADEVNFIEGGSTVTMLLQEEELYARDASSAGWDARGAA
jgi:uncharacterized protein (TIGR02118 family)